MNPIPSSQQNVNNAGPFTTSWFSWLDQVYRILNGNQPLQLAPYTVATLPSVALGQIIFVTDAAPTPVVAYSNGTDWLRIDDNTVIV